MVKLGRCNRRIWVTVEGGTVNGSFSLSNLSDLRTSPVSEISTEKSISTIDVVSSVRSFGIRQQNLDLFKSSEVLKFCCDS